MKTKIAAALVAVVTVFTTACEQHKWSDTKKLFESHEGEHGAATHGAKAEHHADKAEAHGEKKADAHAEPKH